MNDIKSGFETIEDILTFIIQGQFSFIEEFKIIRFRNQYYAVAYQSSKKEVVIMKDFIWYMSDYGEVITLTTDNFTSNKIPYYKLKSRAIDVSPAIHNDMLRIDPNIEIYKLAKTNDTIGVKPYNTSKNIFYVILGLYFYNYRYTVDELEKAKPYFKNYKDFEQLFKNNITHINPFRGLAYKSINGLDHEIPYSFDYVPYPNGTYGILFNVKDI